MEDETNSDYDAACLRIQTASQTLLASGALPAWSRTLLKQMTIDATYLLDFGKEADRMANEADWGEPE